MEFFQNMTGRQMALFALIAFVAAMVLAQSSGLLTILLLGGALYMLSRMYDNSRTSGGSDRAALDREAAQRFRERAGIRRADAPGVPEQMSRAGAEPVYRHALDAVRAAGHDPDEMKVLPVDVGLVVYRGDERAVYRTNDVPDDADYVQPYVQLRLPSRAVGKVRFELLDSDGQVLFVHEDKHVLERGRNLLSSAARLPIHDGHNMNGGWELRISADGMPLATHRFFWEEDSAAVIRRHLGEDGEISNEMRMLLAENRLESVSLDELLSPQNDEGQDAPPQQRRSAAQ